MKLIDLIEVKMSPSATAKMAQGANAMFGFEAEMVFPGFGVAGDADIDDYVDSAEPDMTADRDTTGIEDIVDFFSDGDRSLSSRNRRDLEQQLRARFSEWKTEERDGYELSLADDYMEYKVEHDWFDERERLMTEAMEEDDLDIDEIGVILTNPRSMAHLDYKKEAKRRFTQKIRDDVANRSSDFIQFVLDESHAFMDSLDWSAFVGANPNFDTMSGVADELNLAWPYLDMSKLPQTEWSLGEADRLAVELGDALSQEVIVLSGHNRQTKNTTSWYIEPDSSVEPNRHEVHAMPAEIVSPPMPINYGIEQMKNFFAWANKMGAYTNVSTGFHVSVSLPWNSQGAQNVDYLKLMLFLGDKHVLDEFRRNNNQYCRRHLVELQDQMISPEMKERILTKMKHGLITSAASSIAHQNPGKYYTVNVKSNYIEFRGAGHNYHTNVDKLVDTVNRYIAAMTIASDPNTNREEYAKKLFKLITDMTPPVHTDTVQLFVNYSTGKNLSMLKQAVSDFRGAEKREREKEAHTRKLWPAIEHSVMTHQNLTPDEKQNILNKVRSEWESSGDIFSGLNELIRFLQSIGPRGQGADTITRIHNHMLGQ